MTNRILLLLALQPAALAPAQDGPSLVSVERVWDRAGHNAFTSLLRAHERYYCAFREGTRHVHGLDGTVRVIVSDDAQNWRSLALLDVAGVDLRDPKLSLMPGGRILVTIGGSHYRDRKLLKREPMVAFSDEDGLRFSTPEPAGIDPAIATDDDWLWRVTWREGTGYGVVYRAGPQEGVNLVATTDGTGYRHVVELAVDGRPNETTLRFLADGRMVALMRREAGNRHGTVGVSEAPYTDWTWNELPVRLGGPEFAVLPDGRLLAASREYGEGKEGTRTVLAFFRPDGDWRRVITLPSGGDTSYAGMVVEEGRLLVSYYSSHEGKAAIYLATLRS